MMKHLWALCLAPLLGIGVAPRAPELVLQVSHGGVVQSSSFSPDGKTLVSIGIDRVAKLWDVPSGRLRRTIPVSELIPWRVAFHPNGTSFFTIGSDKLAALWDARTGDRLRAFEGHAAPISAVTVTPDGQRLVTAGHDGAVLVWSVEKGTQERALEPHASTVSALAVSPDGARLVSAATDKVLRLWELASGVRLASLTTADVPQALAFSPDGKQFACSEGGSVTLRDAASGAVVRTLGKHDKDVVTVAYRAGGAELVTGAQNELKIWRTATGELLKTVTERGLGMISGSVSVDGALAATGLASGVVATWDLETGKKARVLSGTTYGVGTLTFSAEGRLLAERKLDGINIWNLAEGRLATRLPAPLGFAYLSAAFAPLGGLLAVGDKAYAELRQIPKEKLAKAGISVIENGVHLFDSELGEERTLFLGHAAPVCAVAFSPDGATLASGDADGTLLFWDATTSVTQSSTPLGKIAAHTSRVLALAYDPAGKQIVSLAEKDGVKVWDAATRKPVRTLADQAFQMTALAFSPDGRVLAAGGSKRISLFDASTGAELRHLDLGNRVASALAFTPDGTKLVWAGFDRDIHVVMVATGESAGELKGHTESVTTLAFRPGTTMLVSGSFDATIGFWRLDPARRVATLVPARDSNWVAAAPDGLFDGTAAGWNSLQWRFDNDSFKTAPLEQFFNEFYHPGLLQEVLGPQPPAAPREISSVDRRQPSVAITMQLPTGPVTTRTVQVKLHVSEAPPDPEHPAGSGARDVRLFRNGVMVKTWPGSVVSTAAVDLTAELPIVAGANRFLAYAFSNENIKSTDATLNVEGAQSLKRPGVARILAIGINAYQDKALDLKFAVPDASAMAAALKDELTRLKTYDRVEISSLTDGQATKAGIQKALAELASAQLEDTVFIYCASHGKTEAERFNIIPHDVKPLSDLELEQAVRTIDAGHLVMIIDACNSGQLLESEERRRGPMNSKGLAQLAYEKGMFVLTAAQSQQAALEIARLGHGCLTYALVEEGLKGLRADIAPKDGKLQVGEWFEYATARVPQMQLEKTRSRLGGPANKAMELARQLNVQRPRAFARREAVGRPLLLHKP